MAADPIAGRAPSQLRRQRKGAGMNLQRLALRRAESAGPIGVALIGAGKFGSMFLAQVSHMPGITVKAIADLFPDRVPAKLAKLGWAADRIDAVRLTDDVGTGVEGEDIDVVVEATG